MRWGSLEENERRILEDAAERGKAPREFTERPRVPWHLAWIWAGWWRLHRGRAWSESGPRGLSPADALALFDLDGVTSADERLLAETCFAELDLVMFADVKERRQRAEARSRT